MLAGILGSMLVAGSAVVAYKNYGVTQDSVRVARVKNMVTVVEAQLRRRALQPEAYVGCDSQHGLDNCVINPAYFSDLALRPVTGAKCPTPGTPCGIRVTGVSLLKPAREFRATIAYDGGDANLKPVAVSIVVPVEVLQDENFNCGAVDPTKPIFAGFDANGKPDCQGFNSCAAGQFISAIDVASHTVTCSPLPANAACSGEQMFSLFNWNGSGSAQTQCVGLPDPPFRSNLETRRPAQAPPPNMTPPTILSATATATSTGTASSTSTDTSGGLKWFCPTSAEWNAGTMPAYPGYSNHVGASPNGYYVNDPSCPDPRPLSAQFQCWAGMGSTQPGDAVTPAMTCSAARMCLYYFEPGSGGGTPYPYKLICKQ